MTTQTHWKKLYNPDYLGAYSLDPGKDMVLTIKTVSVELVTGTDGKKEENMVMRFEEKGVKPMVLNSTNSKTIQKLYKTPYIEDWTGKKIQLFVENVKAFGEVVEALRIRPTPPRQTNVAVSTKCVDCESIIQAFGSMTAEKMALYTTEKYGRAICSECAKKIKEKAVENNVNQ
jgi:hypothetical protein